MHLLFVGDGERDAQTVPFLVEGILGIPIEAEIKPWARLREPGHGYRKKLRYALVQARALEVRGLVATVDRDRDEPHRRLNELKAGLSQDQAKNPAMPSALGEAVPHGEAWLLDDSVAVRQVLGISEGVRIPAVGKVAKATLNDLISNSSLTNDHMTALRDIARAVDISRCKGAKKTGLAAFAKEVKSELGPRVASRRTSS